MTEKEEGDETVLKKITKKFQSKKNIRKIAINAMIGVGALYLVYDTFLAPEVKKAPVKTTSRLSNSASHSKNPKNDQVKSNTNPEARPEDAPSPKEPSDSISDLNLEDKIPSESAAESAPTPEKTLDSINEPISITPNETISESTQTSDIPPVLDPKLSSDNPELSTGPSGEGSGQPQEDVIAEPTNFSNGKNDGENSLTSEILEDLEKEVKRSKILPEIKEYVPPPDYEYSGRGLVYNCQGKHWACVDAKSYSTCEENYSSVKYLKKKIECYPSEIYLDVKDCQSMQNRRVTTSTRTDFCSN